MPLIMFEGGKMDREKKAQLVKEMTEAASRILNIPEQAFMMFIKENEFDNIGTGGKLLSDTMKK